MSDDGLAKPGAYAASIPYAVPDSLDQLTGPTSGTVELPISIDWSRDRTYDLDDPDDRRWLYTRVIREAASAEELASLLNRDLLVELWPQMHLPRHCVERWHARFPELARIGSAIRW